MATMIFTFTLYCTIIPRFSFWVVLRMLNTPDSLTLCSEEKETHIVDEARLVSSCFNLPSKAKPRLSLLLAKSGVKE